MNRSARRFSGLSSALRLPVGVSRHAPVAAVVVRGVRRRPDELGAPRVDVVGDVAQQAGRRELGHPGDVELGHVAPAPEPTRERAPLSRGISLGGLEARVEPVVRLVEALDGDLVVLAREAAAAEHDLLDVRLGRAASLGTWLGIAPARGEPREGAAQTQTC
jgi:hypothetical protein